MDMIRFSFQSLLSLLLCYASFVSIYISFFKNRQYDFLTCFFVLTLFIFAVASIKQIYSQIGTFNIKDTFNSNRKRNIAIFILCFVSLAIGFFNVYTQYSRGMFFDELTQFLLSSNLSDIIEVSYSQQQPPLDYYFRAVSSELWEQSNKISIRFHAMLFYLILSLVLPLGIYRFTSSLWISSVGTLLFLINHIIRLHAVNARPLSLALFTGFLFLFFYLSYCNDNHSDRKDSFSIIASQYLFLMSIGLQPVVFMISLFISSFSLFFNNTQNSKILFKNLFLSHFITVLLALPFYMKMYFYSKYYYKFKTISLDVISDYILNYDIFDLFKKYFFPFYEQLIPCIYLFLLYWGIVVFSQKKISKLTVMTGLALVLFPPLYDFIFYVAINWPLNNWYFIVLNLFLILFVSLGLREIDQFLKTVKWKYVWLVPMSGLFLYSGYFQILSIKNETRFQHPYLDNSMQKVYDYLKKNGTSDDVVIDFSLASILGYKSKDTYRNKILFYKPNLHPQIMRLKGVETRTQYRSANVRYFHIYYIDWEKVLKKGFQKVFFITDNYTINSNNKANDVLSGFMKGQRFGNYIIFELILKSDNKEKEYVNFLFNLISKTPKRQSTVLYETLLYYAFKNKNRETFNQLLKEYKSLEPALGKIDPQYRFPEWFELRRRVKYFENFDWNTDKGSLEEG